MYLMTFGCFTSVLEIQRTLLRPSFRNYSKLSKTNHVPLAVDRKQLNRKQQITFVT